MRNVKKEKLVSAEKLQSDGRRQGRRGFTSW